MICDARPGSGAAERRLADRGLRQGALHLLRLRLPPSAAVRRAWARTACSQSLLLACGQIKRPARFLAPALHQLANSPIRELLERVPEAEHHHVDVRRLTDRAEVCSGDRDQVAVERSAGCRSACRWRRPAALVRIESLTRRWPTPQLLFSRLPKLVMSRRIWPVCLWPAILKTTSWHDAQVDAVDHRQEHRVALGVLAAVRAQVAVVVDQLSRTRRPDRRRCRSLRRSTVSGLKFISEVSVGM